MTLTAKVLPPPPLALTSIVPLSWAGSNGLSSSTVRPGSVNANGIPVGEPQRVPDQRDGVADVAGHVLARQRARRRGPSGSEDCHSSGWLQLPLVDAGVGGGGQLPGRLLDRLGELDRVGVGAALADRLVDRQLVDRRALGPGQLFEQLAGLFFLGEHLVVGRPAPAARRRG